MSLLMIMTFSFSDGLLGFSSLVYAEASVTGSAVAPAVGDGTKSNPYQIANYDNLIWFQQQIDGGRLAINAKLTADITANEDLLANLFNENEEEFTPQYTWSPICQGIEDMDLAYSGTLDGNGYSISGLYYYKYNNTSYVGLFGKLNGTIKNLTIKDSYFNGYQYVSTFAGKGSSNSKIENCSSSATIYVYNGDSGGIAGYTLGRVIGCYFAGKISTPQVKTKYSSAVACDSSGIITNCVYLADCGLTSSRATAISDFASGEACFLLNGGITDGSQAWYQNIGSDSCPFLAKGGETIDKSSSTVYKYYDEDTSTKGYRNEPYTFSHSYENGICQKCDMLETPSIVNQTYQISNYGNLIWFQQQVDKCGDNAKLNAVLTADIIANKDLLANLFDEEGNIKSTPQYTWTPILQGFSISNDDIYSGIFDGNGYSISGLYYNNSNKSYVGLFGSFNGTIKNLIIKDSYFCGGSRVASFAGMCHNNAKILNCGSLATIKCDSYYCAGIANSILQSSKISNCYYAGSIPSNDTSNTSGAITGGSDVNNTALLSNCCYLEGCGLDAYIENTATPLSEEDFSSGKACYLLNGGITDGNQAWYQTLGEDSYPVLTPSSSIVYKGYDGENIVYQNEEYICSEHVYDEKEFCEICGNCKEPDFEDGAYQIASYSNLVWLQKYIGTNPERQSTNAVLTADIVANEDLLESAGNVTLKNVNPKYVWTPIWQTADTYFSGTIDGQGHSISGLYNNSESSYIGLIGASNGTIKNLIIKDSYFKGNSYVGSFVGKGQDITINNCGSLATIQGNSFCGGISGSISSLGLIKGCYFFGYRSGSDNTDSITNGNGSIRDCCISSGVSSNATTVNYSDITNGKTCYLLNGGITDGSQAWYQTLGEDKFPVLTSSSSIVYRGYDTSSNSLSYNNTGNYSCDTDGHKYTNEICVICGIGTEPTKTTDGTYQIANYGNLVWFQHFVDESEDHLNANAVLTADIKINTSTSDYLWTPICQNPSENGAVFSGTFDGAGHYISGLYCHKAGNFIGLFGNANGTIKNLTIINSYFIGTAYVGSFLGNGSATIQNCGTSASVCAYSNYCGGIAGNFSGSAENCYYLGSISCSANEKDAIAYSENNNASLSNCYYLSSCGAGSSSSGAISKTLSQISDGEICEAIEHKYINLSCIMCSALENGVVPYFNFDLSNKYNNLNLAFYMSISDEMARSNGAYVKVTLPDNTVEEYSLSDADTVTMASFSSKPLYVFPCNVAPWELSKTIKAQIICPNGTNSKEFTFNLKDNLKEDYCFNGEMSYIADFLLNLGGAAQSYFGYSTDNLANEGIDDISPLAISQILPYLTAKTKVSKEGIGSFTGIDLVLDTNMTLNAYFEPEAGVDVSSLTFKVDDATVDFSQIKKIDDKYILSVKDIGIQNSGMLQAHTFNVGDLKLSCTAFDYFITILKDPTYSASATLSDPLIKLSSNMVVYIYYLTAYFNT